MAIILAVLYPVGARVDMGRSPHTSCISNKRQLGIGIQIYLMDHEDQFPFAGHSDRYHSAHDEHLTDTIMPYVKNQHLFSCTLVMEPMATDSIVNSAGPIQNTGTAYFCGHGSMDGKPSRHDSPFRKLLLRNGPSGEPNPNGAAVLEEADKYFVCGHKLSEIAAPAIAPLLMCNGFVHTPGKKSAMEWEWEFLPKSLGGSGQMAEAGTVLVRADTSAKFKKGKYGEMMELIGLRKPLFLARKSK